jgi:hypothetical protein
MNISLFVSDRTGETGRRGYIRPRGSCRYQTLKGGGAAVGSQRTAFLCGGAGLFDT